MEYLGAPPVPLLVDGRVVAEYVAQPKLDPTHGPRPFLHPVRTLAGTVTTDVLPEDHRWHQGVSVAMQDVNGTNLWGGRTYVRDQGYTWRDDHGRIEHAGWVTAPEPSRLAARLRWLDPAGATLIEEERTVTATPVDGRAWRLDVEYTLRNPGTGPVVLGSPATNGRPDGAGYGGFFWRAASDSTPTVFNADSDAEEAVNGSATEWVAFRGARSGSPYTLIFTGLGEGDRWFVRAAQYPGVCVAFAFAEPAVIAPGEGRACRHRVIVADGALTVADVAALDTRSYG